MIWQSPSYKKGHDLIATFKKKTSFVLPLYPKLYTFCINQRNPYISTKFFFKTVANSL